MNTERRGRSGAGPVLHLRWLVAVVLAAVLAPVSAGVASGQPEKESPQFVTAAAQSSLVHVEVSWEGRLVVPRNIYLWPSDGGTSAYLMKGDYLIRTTTTCSGFVASSTGDIVTAGHCVDADSYVGGKGALLETFVASFYHWDGMPLDPAERARLYELASARASVEGDEAGAAPQRKVRITAPETSPKSQPANVLDLESFDEGDVAILTATDLEAPVLPVADEPPESGDSVVASGFSGGVAGVVDSKTAASFDEGTVGGTETVNGTPFTQISADTSPGMSGGPVLDMDGRVVGTVSWAPSDSDSSADFMTFVRSIGSVLDGNGVDNTLSEADQAYRQGLTYFYESRYHDAVAEFDKALALQPGWKMVTDYRQEAVASYPDDVNPPGPPTWVFVAIGAVVLVGAGLLGLLLVRRRRARPSGEAPAPLPEAIPPEPATEAHVFCPNCGAKHDAEAHYCEHCGQPFAAAMSLEHGKT